jgi:hypothetical protein
MTGNHRLMPCRSAALSHLPVFAENGGILCRFMAKSAQILRSFDEIAPSRSGRLPVTIDAAHDSLPGGGDTDWREQKKR